MLNKLFVILELLQTKLEDKIFYMYAYMCIGVRVLCVVCRALLQIASTIRSSVWVACFLVCQILFIQKLQISPKEKFTTDIISSRLWRLLSILTAIIFHLQYVNLNQYVHT